MSVTQQKLVAQNVYPLKSQISLRGLFADFNEWVEADSNSKWLN